MEVLPDLQAKIDELAAKLKAQLAAEKTIDYKRLQQLEEMRRNRDYSLAKLEEERRSEMQKETRAWREKIPTFTKSQMKIHASTIEEIEKQMDAYDLLAEKWILDEVCPWVDSEAAATAAGVLILFNEIR